MFTKWGMGLPWRLLHAPAMGTSGADGAVRHRRAVTRTPDTPAPPAVTAPDMLPVLYRNVKCAGAVVGAPLLGFGVPGALPPSVAGAPAA